MVDKKLYAVSEVLKYVPLSKAGLYLACGKGQVPTVRVGRRLFIPAWWVEEITSKPIA
ncbi:MAG: hypothetical protein P4N59_04655 [Negativicutes bacterium]|jgi:hypothetical protein|nr:hypothetical protein [Negativicutes bacterium]